MYFAKALKKTKAPFCLAQKYWLLVIWYYFHGNSELYNLNSAETIEVFYNLRMDIEKLSYVATMLQIINDVCMEGETCYKKLQLLLNTLYTLSETNKNTELVFAIFQIRLLAILGFVPRLRKMHKLQHKCRKYKRNIF